MASQPTGASNASNIGSAARHVCRYEILAQTIVHGWHATLQLVLFSLANKNMLSPRLVHGPRLATCIRTKTKCTLCAERGNATNRVARVVGKWLVPTNIMLGVFLRTQHLQILNHHCTCADSQSFSNWLSLELAHCWLELTCKFAFF